MTPTPRPTWPATLTIALLIQIAVSFLSQAMNVLAPALTTAAGVAPEHIGWLAGLVAFGTAWFLMAGGALIANTQPGRLLQIGVLLAAAGLALNLANLLPLTFVAAVLIGLGYGPAPPASNQLLIASAPPQHRSLIFSIKQAGAPVGSALAGLLLPTLTELLGWNNALGVASLLAIATAVAVEPLRRKIEPTSTIFPWHSLTHFGSPGMLAAPYQTIQESPLVRRLAVAGLTLAIAQGGLFALFATYLVTSVGTSLSAAGVAFAFMQITGAFARVIVGWAADRLRSPPALLAALAIISSVVLTSLSLIRLEWGWATICTISAAAGFCAAGWNGVLMAEIAKRSPLERVGQVSAAATFFIFVGYVLGPSLLALLAAATGSYTITFIALAAVPLIAAAALLQVQATDPRS